MAITLLRTAGYSYHDIVFGNIILMSRLDTGQGTIDPYDWGNRTLGTSHNFIKENFDGLKNGDVIDVEFILGESMVKKISQNI